MKLRDSENGDCECHCKKGSFLREHTSKPPTPQSHTKYKNLIEKDGSYKGKKKKERETILFFTFGIPL